MALGICLLKFAEKITTGIMKSRNELLLFRQYGEKCARCPSCQKVGNAGTTLYWAIVLVKCTYNIIVLHID